VLEREKVLDAGLVLLLEHGPSRMRLADLARQLGVVPSALHYHFPGGKDEVIAAIFDREEARALEAMTSASALAETPHRRLLAMATARLKNASRLARLHRADDEQVTQVAVTQSPATELQDYVLQRRHAFLDRERALIAEILRSGARGRVNQDRIEMLAAAFQGAMFNLTRTFASTTQQKAAGVLAELVDLFFVGVERRANGRR
jgi:AcrR family transcriptional regulator